MINIATSFLALLQEEDVQMKSLALEKLNLLVDDHWPEISDYIRLFKEYYEKNTVPNKNKLLALILSKLYYNLEDYTQAVEWALKSEDSFDIKEKSQYVVTILKKMLDQYIEIRKHNFFNRENQKPIDNRINSIIENVFNNCLQDNRLNQALGFCIESYDLDRLTKAIESSKNVLKKLNFVYDIVQNYIINKEYNAVLIDHILKLLIKHARKEYMEITSCQFFLNNSDALASTLLNILKDEEDPSIAYQIAFDLYDNQNPSYLRLLTRTINTINVEKKLNLGDKIQNLNKILTGETSREIILKYLKKYNHFELKSQEDLMKAVEKGGSIENLGVILTNSFSNSHTGNDEFIKKNMAFVSKANNWARFIATASLGVINMGDTKNSRTIMNDYLPGGANSRSLYCIGGAYYGIGLIHAGTNDPEIMAFFNEALSRPGNNKEAIQHGIYLGIGLTAMATHDQELYERVREGIYTDDALIGEAAGYAVGLIMVGSKDEGAIDDLVKYVHDTQHEKIIRAIAIALALIVYNAGEAADSLIEQLCREKDPILRYGAMYCIGMAYCGTGNTAMLQKLIKFSVSDVSDAVRRAALINIGFLEIRTPDILFENLKVLGLLSESYNSHVRFGATMAIGITCAGSGKVKPYKVIEPLFTDPNYLVRQAALISSGLIFSQTTLKQEEGIKEYLENLEKILVDKNEHLLIKFGAMISKGLLNLGGKNCTINLVSNTGENKMKSIIGMCLFTQYYYWFPMIHMLNLSVSPTILFNLDDQLKVPINYKLLSKAKPSVYAYTKEEEKDQKKKEVKTETAVLSTHTRNKAKAKKTGTLSNMDIKSGNLTEKNSIELKPSPSGPIPTSDKEEKKDEKKDEKKEEEIKIDTSKVEPEEEEIANPMRILPLQRKVISELPNSDFEPITHGRYSGFLMLRRKRPDVVSVYDEPVEEKKEENKNADTTNANNTNNGYTALPQEDFEIPEDFNLDDAK